MALFDFGIHTARFEYPYWIVTLSDGLNITLYLGSIYRWSY